MIWGVVCLDQHWIWLCPCCAVLSYLEPFYTWIWLYHNVQVVSKASIYWVATQTLLVSFSIPSPKISNQWQIPLIIAAVETNLLVTCQQWLSMCWAHKTFTAIDDMAGILDGLLANGRKDSATTGWLLPKVWVPRWSCLRLQMCSSSQCWAISSHSTHYKIQILFNVSMAININNDFKQSYVEQMTFKMADQISILCTSVIALWLVLCHVRGTEDISLGSFMKQCHDNLRQLLGTESNRVFPIPWP